MTDTDSLPVVRDPAIIRRFVGGGLLFLAVAAYNWYTGYVPMVVIGSILGFGGIWYGLTTGGANCPDCGALMSAPMDSELYVACPGCGAYYRAKSGRVWKLEEKHISPYPVFAVAIAGDKDAAPKFRWPDACCVCGKTPSDKQSVTMTYSIKKSNIGDPGERKITLTVGGIPHCKEHQMGTTLDLVVGVPSLKFRSYSYRNAFRSLNPAS